MGVEGGLQRGYWIDAAGRTVMAGRGLSSRCVGVRKACDWGDWVIGKSKSGNWAGMWNIEIHSKKCVLEKAA